MTMWAYEHSVEADVTPEAIWALWKNVAGWGSWNDDIEAITLTGPFAAGSEISMTPVGQEPVELRLETVVENREFTDVCEVPGIEIWTRHLVEPVEDGGVRVTYRTEISGPAADQVGPELGPQITGDFPQTLAALVKLAGQG